MAAGSQMVGQRTLAAVDQVTQAYLVTRLDHFEFQTKNHMLVAILAVNAEHQALAHQEWE